MTRLSRLAARALRRLSRRFSAKADKLDPPIDDQMAYAQRACDLFELVRAGRIRQRRGESDRSFTARLMRGEYEIVSPVVDIRAARALRQKAKVCS